MASIQVSDQVREQIQLLARAWETTEGEAVRRLIVHFRQAEGSATDDAPTDEVVGVYAIYEGLRIEGRYFPPTRRLEITSGALAGRSYKSPSGAAIAVVQSVNPKVRPNRNGWSFWTVTETGMLLQSIRGDD